MEDILKFLSGDFGPDNQNILFETFNETPIYKVRRACLEKIIPDGKENLLWLAETVGDYLKINDHGTILLLLEKLSQLEGDLQEDAFSSIVVVMNTWLKEDNRPALKSVLDIIYKKIEKKPDLYCREVREIFWAILEKYDNNGIERTEADFEMLDGLVIFIRRIDRNYFIPILKKKVKTWKEIKEMQKPSLLSCGRPISQILFEMDKGIIAGEYKDIIEAAKAESK